MTSSLSDHAPTDQGPQASEHAYMMNRDYRSSMRLNYNHWLNRALTGFLIKPLIPKDGKMRIADIGSGTGIWAAEASMESPSAQFDCFDISPAQFSEHPPHPNVAFHVHDCFQPFAQEFLGAFDVVHLRYWLLLVNDPDAPRVVENMLTLLKPGGHLQWTDMLPLGAHIVKPDPTEPSPGLDKLLAMWKKPRPDSTYEWTTSLPDIYHEAGLEVVSSQVFPMKDQYRLPCGLSQVAGFQDVVKGMRFAGGQENTVDFMQKVSEECYGEFKKGMGIDVETQCVVGRKM